MEFPWFLHPDLYEVARCVPHWGLLPLVRRENLIEKRRGWHQLSVGLWARSDQSPVSPRNQGRFALGLLPFPTFLRYPRLHRLHSNARFFGKGGNEVRKFVGLHLGRGQDHHGVVDQALDRSLGYRGFC